MNRIRYIVPLLLIALVVGLARPAAAQNFGIYTWGTGGGGGTFISDSPTEVNGQIGWNSTIQAANFGGLAISGSGQVLQWNASPSPTANRVAGVTKAVSVGEGQNFGAAVTSAGTVWTWGKNTYGDLCLGIPGTESNVPPTQVSGISDALAVAGGGNHLLILLSTGKLLACGQGNDGQLGNGRTVESDVPVDVSGPGQADIVKISAGSNTSAAVDSTGQLYMWGDNQWGQLANGTTTNSDVPIPLTTAGPVLQVYAGGDGQSNGQTIALLNNGSVYAWGNDQWGQLGNGETETDSTTPVRVVKAPADVTAVATGGQSSYLLSGGGQVYAWGDDSKGQLGDGRGSGIVLNPELVASGFSSISATASLFVGG